MQPSQLTNLSSVADVYRQRQRERMKKRYADFNATQRKEYIDRVKKYKKQRNSCILVDQIPCESEGPIVYEPVCSEKHELKKMSNCIHCGAVRFEYEPPTFCCDNGKIKLATIEVPDELYELFTSQSDEAIQFRKNIRPFNCIFSFTSFGVKLDKELASARRGVYTFRAQGMVYHNLPGLKPKEDGPDHFQLYFVETENEVGNRMKILENSSISEITVKKLLKVLEENPYAKVFRRLKDFPSTDDVQLHISKDVKLDQRVYNSPTADQVAAIWVEGNNVNIPFERDIVVHAYSGDWHRIKHYYGCYDPLQYPLLFPRGETGWHQNIKKLATNKSTTSTHITIGESSIRGEQVCSRTTVDASTTTSSFSSADDILSQEQEG